MAGPLIIGAEGVLLIRDEESYAASRPVDEGIELALQLSHFPTSRVVILVDLVDTEPMEHFCRIHGLTKAATVGIAPEDAEEDSWRAQWYALERQRSSGPVNMVLTAHPEVFSNCTASHQPAILFARRGALGDLEVRSTWNELHERVIRSRDARVAHETQDA